MEGVTFSKLDQEEEHRLHEVVLFSRRNSGTEVGRLKKVFLDYKEACKALEKLVYGGAYSMGTIRINYIEKDRDLEYLGTVLNISEDKKFVKLSVQDVIKTFLGNRKFGVIKPMMSDAIRLTEEVLKGNYDYTPLEN